MPNLILFNGKLHTQDLRFPQASALAARDGRILAVGNDAEIRSLAAEHTQEIDLHGKLVLPGLTDSHIHFYEWALLMQGLRLEGVRSLAELQEQVREARQKKGAWIIGQGWDESLWQNPKLPTKADLDAVAPETPVILWRKDLHLAVVNSAALRRAKIDRNTPNPPMGIIRRNRHGEPNGLLHELAINLVREVLPVADAETTDAAMRRSMARLHRLGVTGVHDFRIMGGEDGAPALRAFQRLRERKELKLRAFVMLPGEFAAQAAKLGLRSGFGDDFLRLGGIKLFADGALGPRTAWMLEEFAEGGTGMPLTPMQEMAQKISLAEKAGLTTAIHAIGDRALRELLDVYGEVLGTDAQRARDARPKHRIEHVQHTHPEDVARLARFNLVASVQPLHLTEDMEMVNAALGERARWAYPLRDLLDAGTVLAFGSDCPVVSPNPFLGIQAAVTRQRDEGMPAEGWYPEQRLSVAEAVYAYTMGAAIAAGKENAEGSLSPGKLADFIVLDRDIFEIPLSKIGETEVEMTVFNGERVFQR
jgi:predicted amidohydrolase YtcJ